MTSVLVFTPSYRPGFDVTLTSLQRQTHFLSWSFGDDLYRHRHALVQKKGVGGSITNAIHWEPPPRVTPFRRNLARAYSIALSQARILKVDLLISLQDYIWIPDDGVERFVAMAEKFPDSLLTGICSFSEDPEPEKIVNKDDPYTIFGKPYTDKPQRMGWIDSRLALNYAGQSGYVESNQIEWETNWAAIPKSVIDLGIDFDEDYDQGAAYENQAFAFECREKAETNVVLDLDNQSISLNHKKYWPQEEIDDAPFNQSNYELHLQKWSAPRV